MSENAQPIQITTYFSWASLAEIVPAWENILNENATLSIFSTPEWLKSWWDAFGSGRQLVVLAFLNSAGTLVGLAPMYWETSRHPVFGRIKQLRLVGDGSGDSDNLDFIIRPGSEEACISAFIQWMTRQRNCGICSLNTLPVNSLAASVLSSHLTAEKWPVRQTSTPNSAISLPDSWETYIEGLSPKFRRLISRCRRKLESQFNLRFRRCESAEEIPPMLETLYALHQKRWNSVHEPGSFGSAQRKELYARMSKAFFEKGWLELWSLELNGKPVAAQMSFRYRDRVYGLQEGFDTDYSAHHVGYVLRAGMFESFIRSGIKVYDFLGGTSPQKQRWGAEVGAYTNLQFATPRTIASCLLALDKKAADSKEWLRHHLPSVAWNVLHRVKIGFAHENAKAGSESAAEQLRETENAPEGVVFQ
jgi:CelD/BcsL family acetyltransferase involved in cellulose biosynthesis